MRTREVARRTTGGVPPRICALLTTNNGKHAVSSSSSSSSADDLDAVPPKRQCNCLNERFGTYFMNKEASDVRFFVGKEEEELPAHKIILTSGSAVFKRVMEEAKSAKIKVPDEEPSVFLAVLSFLYKGETKLAAETANAVLRAARKYAVKGLENLCVDFLIQNLSPYNTLAVLNEWEEFGYQNLKDACMKNIDEDTAIVIAADAFCDITEKTLCLILQRNSLRIREGKLFEAICRWSEAECSRKNQSVNQANQRSVLNNVLPLIRFPIMTVEEFSHNVSRSGLLTNEELVSIYQFFVETPKPPIAFSAIPRAL